jgi:hypothetical protein
MIEVISQYGMVVNDVELQQTKMLLIHGAEIKFSQQKGTMKFIFQTLVNHQETSFQKSYCFLNEIGHGSFSVVKLALDRKSGKKFAVKIIDKKKYSFDTKMIASFESEVRKLKR